MAGPKTRSLRSRAFSRCCDFPTRLGGRSLRDQRPDGGAALWAKRGPRGNLNQATGASGQPADLLLAVTDAPAQATGRVGCALRSSSTDRRAIESSSSVRPERGWSYLHVSFDAGSVGTSSWGFRPCNGPALRGSFGENWCCLRPRVPQLDGTTNEACRTSAGWCRESTPDARTTSCRVEPLGIDVLLEDPQEHAQRRPAFGDDPRRLLEQGGSDPIPLESGGHMQIVDEGTPEWISVERGVDETHELPVRFGHDGASIPARLCHSADPDLQTISDDVAVEVRVGIRTPVVTTPALSVEPGHCSSVASSANAVQHMRCVRHTAPHRSWRWHRAARPGVGPSKGQVPRVTLDEQQPSYGRTTSPDGSDRRVP